MRGVDLAVFVLVAKVIRVEAVSSIMAATQAMAAIPKAVAILNIVPGPATPVTYLAVVLAPSINGAVANGDLSLAPSLAFEIGGLVYVAVNATANAGDGISGSKVV